MTMEAKSVIKPMKPSIKRSAKTIKRKFATQLKERCEDVMGKKCKAIKSSKHERKCYDVTELLCSLKENVQYEEIPAVFTVQKCHNVKERVCDTVYETEITERDDFKCVNVINPYCAVKEHTVYDKTCRNLVLFDCKADSYVHSVHRLLLP